MRAPLRARWKYADHAKAFHARHGHAPYTMTPNAALEAEMNDPGLPAQWRFLAAVRRFSWGHLSDFAVDAMPKIGSADPEPRPMTQQAICRAMNPPMPESTGSVAANWLKSSGYLRPEYDNLYPVDNRQSLQFASIRSPDFTEKLTGVNSDSMNSDELGTSKQTPFARFKQQFLAEHPDLNRTLVEKRGERARHYAEARSCAAAIQTIDRQILGEFRNWQRRNGADSNRGDGAQQHQTLESASDSVGAGSVSEAERFTIPADSVRDSSGVKPHSRIHGGATPNEITAAATTVFTLEGFNHTKLATTTPARATPEEQVVDVHSAPDEDGKRKGEAALVLDKLNSHGTTTSKAATKLLDDCRQQQPGCTVEQVIEQIEILAARFTVGARNPMGILLTQVPLHIANLIDRQQNDVAAAAAKQRRQEESCRRIELEHRYNEFCSAQVLRYLKSLPPHERDRIMAEARRAVRKQFPLLPAGTVEEAAARQVEAETRSNMGLPTLEEFQLAATQKARQVNSERVQLENLSGEKSAS